MERKKYEDIPVGAIVVSSVQIKGDRDVAHLDENRRLIYYELKEGWFAADTEYEDSLFYGRHFECLGSDYYHGMKNGIFGYEIFNEQNTINVIYPNGFNVPDNLF